ncbi:MAG: Ig-like domain-containing protein, partial [Clostridia bacterium]|nr:Ig-like domain-containing protein [Clostridia bacterium]
HAMATVSRRGQVTGRRAGETTVTATLADGRAYAWTLTVTQPVTAVKLPVSKLTLERGQTAQLSPVIRPEDATDRTLAFTSSDESVARVDVTASSPR